MSPNIQIQRDRIAAHLAPHLGAESSIHAAFLFGSALESMRPDSDIDIGIVASCDSEYQREALASRIEAAAGRLDAHPFDVLVLSRENVLFSFRVVRDGALIYVSDPDVLGSFIEAISRPFAELSFRHRQALVEVLAEVRG